MITRRSILRGLVAAPAVVAASSLMPVSSRYLDFVVKRDINRGGYWVTGYDMYNNLVTEFISDEMIINNVRPGIIDSDVNVFYWSERQ